MLRRPGGNIVLSWCCQQECAEFAGRCWESSREVILANSFTGVAGPDTHEGQPVGKVFIGLSTKDHTDVFEWMFYWKPVGHSQTRCEIRLHHLLNLLKES
ncbi:CinA family protein [Bacillus sp. SL00103]